METKQLTKAEFQRILSGFHGTEQYHLHRLPSGATMNLTDGCAFVRENAGAGAYWLFDLILSYQHKLASEAFQVLAIAQAKQRFMVCRVH